MNVEFNLMQRGMTAAYAALERGSAASASQDEVSAVNGTQPCPKGTNASFPTFDEIHDQAREDADL